MVKESSTFCIYPWDHLATLTNGSIIPCCVAADEGNLNINNLSFAEAWNSSVMKKIRQQMLQGEKVKACQRCYAEESAGLDSLRIQSNYFYRQLLGSFDYLIENTSADGHFKGPIKSVDLRLGNNCNLKCIMCRPNESSSWAAEIETLIENTNDKILLADLKWKSTINKNSFLWHKNPEFWNAFKKIMPDIREITFGGGEPFLIPEQFAFLNECVALGHSKYLSIKYHTNGTVLPDDVLDLLTHFRHVDIMVSLDGLDYQNFYMRYPAKWLDILTTLHKLDKTPNSISVNILTTLHAISIYYFPEFIKWFKTNAGSVKYVFHIGARTDTTEFNKSIFDELNVNYTKTIWEIEPQTKVISDMGMNPA